MPDFPQPVHAVKPLEWFKDGPNSREIVVDDAIRELCHSIVANGLLQPPLSLDDGTVIAGNRRIAACRLAKLASIPTLMYPSSLTVTQRRVITATENLQRVDLTDPQTYGLCKELLELNPDWAKKDLAAHLAKDASTVTRYLSPSGLIPAALDAFMAGRFGFAKAYELSKLDADDQPAMLAATLGGATRDQMARSRRNAAPRNGQPAVRANRIPCDFASGAKVVVSGEEMTLDEAIEALSEALKEAKKAREQGLDAKTFSAVMRDKAKAGA